MSQLAARLHTGFCTRWHANPDMAHIRETLSEHQWMTAQIALYFWPNDAALLRACLCHDMGEAGFADVSWNAKRKYPELKLIADKIEADNIKALGVSDYVEESIYLKFCDRLAAIFFVAERNPELILNDDYQDEWRSILVQAKALGIFDDVVNTLTSG